MPYLVTYDNFCGERRHEISFADKAGPSEYRAAIRSNEAWVEISEIDASYGIDELVAIRRGVGA